MIGTHDDSHGLIISSGGRPIRRRWVALVVILSVALAGALLGQMSVDRNDAARPTPPGPFSLLPH